MQIFRKIIVTAVIGLITACLCILTFGISNVQVFAQNEVCPRDSDIGIWNIQDNKVKQVLGCVTKGKALELKNKARIRTIDTNNWLEVANPKAGAPKTGWINLDNLK